MSFFCLFTYLLSCICCLQLSDSDYSDDSSDDSDDSSDESKHFWNLVVAGVQIVQNYSDLYLCKNPPRTSNLSGMGWLQETLRTPGECHSQLRMSTEMFIDF